MAMSPFGDYIFVNNSIGLDDLAKTVLVPIFKLNFVY